MKSYFMTRNFREKVLVLLMLAVGLVIWSSYFAERAGALLAERRSLNALHEEFMLYIDHQDVIRDRVETGIENLDPAQTLNATRLSVEAGSMAREYGLNPSIDSPRTEPGDIFSYHTIVMTVNEADLESLIDFTKELQSRAPYMSLEEVSINARSNPMLLDARFRISAVELNRQNRKATP